MAFWGSGVVLLILTLALQAVWWDRNALAAHPDGLRLVQWLCRLAPCKVQPPKAPELIQVLERSLVPHPERPGALRFSLRMTNRNERPQPFPVLELRLIDRREHLAGVRRFAPEQYLARNNSGIMEPNTPMDISLELSDPGEHVVGFQIDFL